MRKTTKPSSTLGSIAEDLFIEVFCEAFGPEKAQYLFIQYPFVDIYGNRRFIDFALENEELKIAIEIDGEKYHNPNKISGNKYYDDLLKQNSLVHYCFCNRLKAYIIQKGPDVVLFSLHSSI